MKRHIITILNCFGCLLATALETPFFNYEINHNQFIKRNLFLNNTIRQTELNKLSEKGTKFCYYLPEEVKESIDEILGNAIHLENKETLLM